MGDKLVIFEKGDDGIATLSINRPDARNSLTRDSSIAVYDALVKASLDRDIKVLIFRGVGKDFCAGADINAANGGKAPENSQQFLEDPRAFEVPILLHEMKAVTIAAIRGGCAGAGFGWASSCDFRVAAPSARFSTAFLTVGVAGDMGNPWFLPRMIGAQKARELCFLAEKFDADEAKQIGYVSRVWAEDAFENELAKFAQRLAGAAPLALAGLKANFVEAERTTLRSYIALETERHTRLFVTSDRDEAFRAFAEKRKPSFTGR